MYFQADTASRFTSEVHCVFFPLATFLITLFFPFVGFLGTLFLVEEAPLLAGVPKEFDWQFWSDELGPAPSSSSSSSRLSSELVLTSIEPSSSVLIKTPELRPPDTSLADPASPLPVVLFE